MSLIRIARQQNLLLVCGGASPMEMRSAHDLVAIAALLGIPSDAAHGAVAYNPRRVGKC